MLRQVIDRFTERALERKGFATALAIWILFILLGMTLTFSQIMLSEIVVASNFLKEAKAYAAAEEGIGMAVHNLLAKINAGSNDLRISEVMTDPPPAGPDHIMISEICQGSAVDLEDEFIELYNPTSNTIDLTNYQIRQFTSGGVEGAYCVISGSIAAKGYFLIGGTMYAGAMDDQKDGGSHITTSNGVSLEDASGATIDKVGWGAQPAAGREGTAAKPLTNNGWSIKRRTAVGAYNVLYGGAYDTDDNSVNFTDSSAAEPQTSASATKNPDPSLLNYTNENKYEFIELYNPTDVAINTSGYQIEVGVGPKKNLNAAIIPPRGVALVVSTQLDANTSTLMPSNKAFYDTNVVFVTFNDSTSAYLGPGSTNIPDSKVLIRLETNLGALISGQEVDLDNQALPEWVNGLSWEKIMPSDNHGSGQWSAGAQDRLAWKLSDHQKGTPGQVIVDPYHYGDAWALMTRNSATGNKAPLNIGDNDVLVNIIDCASGIPVNSRYFLSGSYLATVIDKLGDVDPFAAADANDMAALKPWETQADLGSSPGGSNTSACAFNVYCDTNAFDRSININTADSWVIAGIIGAQLTALTGPQRDALSNPFINWRRGSDGKELTSDDRKVRNRAELYYILTDSCGISAANAEAIATSRLIGCESDRHFRIISKGLHFDSNGDIEIEKKLIVVVKFWKKLNAQPDLSIISYQEEYRDRYPDFRYYGADQKFGTND